MAEAMALWNNGRIHARTVSCDDLVGAGLQFLVQSVSHLRECGRQIYAKDMDFLDGLPRDVEKAIRLLWDTDPLRFHSLVAAEHEFVDFGNARPDIISRDAEQHLVVDDYKVKFSRFDTTWMDKEFEKHWDGEQRMAYTQMVGTDLFGIILVVLNPHTKGKVVKPFVERRVSRVLPHEVVLWKNDAVMDYERMARVEAKQSGWEVPGRVSHSNQYGDCVYKNACVEENLDARRMGVKYVQIQRG